MRTIALVFAALFLSAAAVPALAVGGDKDSPTDQNQGGGNDPQSKAPGQTTNPNPAKLFDSGPAWLSGYVIAAPSTAPGSGNWGGGPGNSGPGDKNGQNNTGQGGQTPPGQG